MDQLRERVRAVRIDSDEITGAAKFVGSTQEFLTGAKGQGGAVSPSALSAIPVSDEHRGVKAFLNEHRALFGHGAEALDGAWIERDDTSAHNGMRTVVWHQMLDGIGVFEGIIKAHTTSRGELINIGSQFVGNPAGAADKGSATRHALQVKPTVTAQEAVSIAAREMGEEVQATEIEAIGLAQGREKRQNFRNAKLIDPNARLTWLPIDGRTLRLCWEVVAMSKAKAEMFRQLVDAQTGEVLLKRSLTSDLSDASYRVFTGDSPTPLSPGWSTPSSGQPAAVERSLVTTPALDTTASPNGWINDGVNETIGNNVDAHLDINADNLPDLPRPQGSPNRVFDFALDLTQSPGTATNQSAAVVQLFYWCNWMHDKLYALGFNEASGNFQTNNFSRGGAGNDAVLADAQDGSGTNNANFSTPSDGYAGRMQMFLFTGPSPQRDACFDAEIVLHEYTHGLSNRLVGGGVGLSALQSRGMGEGWSDFYGMTLLSQAGDDVNGNYAAGAYCTYKLSGMTQNYYYGIRRYPYSTDMSKNPQTLKDIDPTHYSSHPGIPISPIAYTGDASEYHCQGEVWCVTLWEARANLINKHGWAIGNQLILQLVTYGMKLSPSNPTFLQARDAIIQADLVDTGGANRGELWAAFAKRGMGASATTPASSTTTGVAEAYDLPDQLRVSPSAPLSASGPVTGPFTPNSQTFTLTNTGSTSLNWTASKTQTWLSLSTTGGVLAASGSTTVVVSINANANGLNPDTYSDAINFFDVTTGMSQTRSASLTITPPVVLSFNLDTDPGWTRQGQWAFGHPSGLGGGSFGHPDPTSGATGSNVCGVNLSGDYSLAIGGPYYLIAGPFDFSAFAGMKLQFQRWLNSDYQPFVTATVEVSNNGTTWTTLFSNGSATISDAAWTPVQYDISSVADNHAGVYIRWGYQVAGNAWAYSGWNIDDIAFLGTSATPALAITVPATVTKGLQTTGTAAISRSLASDSVVFLSSSIPSQLTVPASVTIPAGSISAPFTISAPDDTLTNGTKVATITGTTTGMNGSSATISVLDHNVHHFSLSPVGSPQFSGVAFTLSITAKDVNGVTISSYAGTPSLTGSGNSGALALNLINAGPFANGVWTGSISSGAIDSNVVVAVDDGAGHRGTTNAFELLGNLPVMSVTPATDANLSGPQGGPFAPSTAVYTIANSGTGVMTWTATNNQPWLTLSANSGILASGSTAMVTATINSIANTLGVGSYGDTLTFTNATNGAGNASRAIAFNIYPANPALSVTPQTGLASTGTMTGPFTPSTITFTLANTGNAPVNWTATKTQSWLTLSASSGALGSGSSAIVVATINSGANALLPGSYSDSVTFVNNNNGVGNTTRDVSLNVAVLPPPQITSPLTVTGSAGVSFSYAITATNKPTSYSASGLPAGLTLNASTGVISGKPTTVGTYMATINAGNVSGTGTASLAITVIPGPLNHFAWSLLPSPQNAGSPFSATITAQDAANNLVTAFNGTAALSVLSTSSTSVQILSWTGYSDNTSTGEYVHTKQAISTYFTNYTETSTTVTDPVQLAAALVGKQVFLVPEQESVPSGTMASLGTAWAGVLTNFVNKGGIVIVCSWTLDEHLLLTQAGLLSATKGVAPSTLSLTSTTNTLLNSGVSVPFTGSYITTYTGINGTASLQSATDGTAVVISRDVGAGHVVVIGTDFYTLGTGMDRVIANAVAWAQVAAVATSVTPASTGAFTGGTWTGDLAISQPATQVKLLASDGAGHSGTSNALDVTTIANMAVSPAGGLSSFGGLGGPFSPASTVYTVTNTGVGSMDWTVSGSSAWLSFSPAGGTLASGSSVTVTATINPLANTLSLGSYSDTISLINSTNGVGNTTRPVSLNVVPLPVITSASSVTGTSGVAFAYTITASNTPLSFNASGLPSGLGVNLSTGLISGTPTQTGTFNPIISASNAAGTGSATLALTFLSTPPVITSGLAKTGTQGAVFSYQISATNSPTSYNAMGLPSGLSVNTSTGLISGAPTQTGTFNATLSATNSGGTGSATLVLTVLPAPPAITSASAATGSTGSAFAYQIVATNNPTSYGASGVPLGLSVNTSTGLISGTPTQNGTFVVYLSATNAGGIGSATLVLTVSLAPPVITSALAVTGSLGSSFNYKINATSTPTSYGATGIPAGLSVSTSTGWISGIPTQTGTFNVAISATNASGSGSATLVLVVVPPRPAITSALTVTGTNGCAFGYQIAATNAPTSFNAAGLPSGLGVDASTGLISGAPTQTGTFNVSLSATNDGGTGSATLALTVLPTPPTITSTLATTGTNGSALSYQIVASNAPTSYNATGLAAGLGVDTFTGLISGIPTQSGTFHATLSATNAGGTGSATLVLNLLPPAPAITSALTARGTNGYAFGFQITATNNPASFGATGLPSGLNVNSSTGLISGTPALTGTFKSALTATNPQGSGTATLTLTIVPPRPVITSPLSTTGTNGSGLLYQITATSSPSTYNAISLPPGLKVNLPTGLISGTPSQSGTFNTTIYAGNWGGSGMATLVIKILPAPPAITSALSGTANQGQAFSYQIAASNGPTSFNATGLPANLVVDTATGLISGTPVCSGSFGVTLSALNTGGTGSAILSLRIQSPFAAWLAGYFGADAPESLAGDAAVNNGAGIANLMAYGLGLDPFSATVGGLPGLGLTKASGTNYLTLSFTRNGVATDLTFAVEGSSDVRNPNGWTPVSTFSGGSWSPAANVSESGTGSVISVQVQEALPAGLGDRRFLRLKVTH